MSGARKLQLAGKLKSLPDGGEAGQILYKTADGETWGDLTNDDEILALLAETGIVDPLTDEDGKILTDENGKIFVL